MIILPLNASSYMNKTKKTAEKFLLRVVIKKYTKYDCLELKSNF